MLLLCGIVLSLIQFARPSLGARVDYGALGCWRDHSNTKSSYNEALSTINRFLSSDNVKPPGSLLRVLSDVIWPRREVNEDRMYCFDEEYHGNIPVDVRKSYVDAMQLFRVSLNSTLNLTRRNARSEDIEKSLHGLNSLVSVENTKFLRVREIETTSMFIREYSMLLLGTIAEYLNFCREEPCPSMPAKQRQRVLSSDTYILAKFSYWFVRFMPKKMADSIIFDRQKFSENHLGFVNQATGKRLSQFDEALTGCGVGDSNSCNDYSLGLLKAARISARLRIEEYWRDLLVDFRRLFKRYCTASACVHDRYEEFFVRTGEPVGLQFLAHSGENGKFCTGELCSAMWLSPGGYKDYGYYRQCMGAGNVWMPPPPYLDPVACTEDQWKICSSAGGCSESTVLKNKIFPVALQSNNSRCLDCSVTSTWCKQASCPNYVNPGGTPSPSQVCVAPESCGGPQYQIHNFRGVFDDPIEILDEVHFSHGRPLDGHMNMLSGDIFSGAFIKTQYYSRLEHKFSVSSKRTGETRGPFYCQMGKSWNMMHIEEQAVCAQSSFTLFKRLNAERVLASDPPDTLSARFTSENVEVDVQELDRIVNRPRDSQDD